MGQVAIRIELWLLTNILMPLVDSRIIRRRPRLSFVVLLWTETNLSDSICPLLCPWVLHSCKKSLWKPEPQKNRTWTAEDPHSSAGLVISAHLRKWLQHDLTAVQHELELPPTNRELRKTDKSRSLSASNVFLHIFSFSPTFIAEFNVANRRTPCIW